MLEVAQTNSQGKMPLLTAVESRSHFGLWAIVSSPLILGFDVTNTTLLAAAWPYISNREAIAVNQQWAGYSGGAFYSSSAKTNFTPCGWWLPSCSFPSVQYFAKPQPNNTTAVILLNSGDQPASLTLTFSTVPRLAPATHYHVRDLWLKADLGVYQATITVTLASRDSAFLLLTPA